MAIGTIAGGMAIGAAALVAIREIASEIRERREAKHAAPARIRAAIRSPGMQAAAKANPAMSRLIRDIEMAAMSIENKAMRAHGR